MCYFSGMLKYLQNFHLSARPCFYLKKFTYSFHHFLEKNLIKFHKKCGNDSLKLYIPVNADLRSMICYSNKTMIGSILAGEVSFYIHFNRNKLPKNDSKISYATIQHWLALIYWFFWRGRIGRKIYLFWAVRVLFGIFWIL